MPWRPNLTKVHCQLGCLSFWLSIHHSLSLFFHRIWVHGLLIFWDYFRKFLKFSFPRLQDHLAKYFDGDLTFLDKWSSILRSTLLWSPCFVHLWTPLAILESYFGCLRRCGLWDHLEPVSSFWFWQVFQLLRPCWCESHRCYPLFGTWSMLKVPWNASLISP